MAPKTTQPESKAEKSFLNWLWIFVSVLLVNVTSIVIANYCFQFKILNGWPKKVVIFISYTLLLTGLYLQEEDNSSEGTDTVNNLDYLLSLYLCSFFIIIAIGGKDSFTTNYTKFAENFKSGKLFSDCA